MSAAMFDAVLALFELITGAPSRGHPKGSRRFAWTLWALGAAALAAGAAVVLLAT